MLVLRGVLAHVHDDDDAQVVVGRDAAVDEADDGKPDKIRLKRGAEDVELGEEPAGGGDADQTQQ